MRSPSNNLSELLRNLQLCTPQELAACERRVRRLCHDLPDFDSVWLDALVQQRVLTPWQVEVLQSVQPQRLQVGEYLLRQPLGRQTWLGQHPAGGAACVCRALSMSVLTANPDIAPSGASGLPADAATAHQRLQELLSTLQRARLRSPESLLLPLQVISRKSADAADLPPQWYVVSAFVPGWSLDELLIRGGRIPWKAVVEIGRDLLAALAWLESVRQLHGEIVLRNVRLTPQGRVVLTSPFVRQLLQPHVVLSEALTLRDCEGVAPEQVGTGRTPDARSELYALGCLLWQLLTCRPVVLSADPVSRLMKIREHDISDVRQFVPDCPEWLARQIQALTRRTPELRPSSFDEVLRHWSAQTGSGHGGCRALVQQMPDRTLRQRTAHTAAGRSTRPLLKTWRMLVWKSAGVLMLIAGIAAGARLGLLPRTLRVSPPSVWLQQLPSAGAAAETSSLSKPDLAGAVSTGGASAAAVPAAALAERATSPLREDTESAPMQIQALPPADPAGVIRLRGGQRYRAEDLRVTGPLQIVADTVAAPAILLVSAERPWQLSAGMVSLRNLQIQTESEEPGAGAAGLPVHLLQVTTGQLDAAGCVLESRTGSSGAACLIWQRLDAVPASVTLQNCILSGSGYGLRLQDPPEHCALQNVLLATDNSGLRCDFTAATQQAWRLDMHRVSARDCVSVLDVVVREPQIPQILVDVQGGESVLAPRQALLRIAAPAGWPMSRMQTEFRLPETGNPTIVPPGTETAVFFDAELKSFVRLAEQQVQSGSLLIAAPLFVADSEDAAPVSPAAGDHRSLRAAGFQLLDYEGPKLNAVMPGIDATLLPPW